MRKKVVWSGEVDLANVWDSHALIAQALDEQGVTEVLIDLGGVTFMDSMGISALLSARNTATERGVSLILEGVTERVQRLFAMTGLTDLFEIVASDTRDGDDVPPSELPQP